LAIDKKGKLPLILLLDADLPESTIEVTVGEEFRPTQRGHGSADKKKCIGIFDRDGIHFRQVNAKSVADDITSRVLLWALASSITLTEPMTWPAFNSAMYGLAFTKELISAYV